MLQQRSSGQDCHLHPCKWPLQVVSCPECPWYSNKGLEKEAQVLSWTMPSVFQSYRGNLQ